METKMSAEAYLAPNLNRFVILLRQNSTAKLELNCKSGQLKVNISHDIGFVEEATTINPTNSYADMLKKNMKVSQLNRLKRRAAERAERAKEKEHEDAEKAKQYEAEVEAEQEKTKAEAKKATEEAEQAKATAKRVLAESKKVKSMCEGLKSSNPVKPKLTGGKSVQRTSNKLKCKVCEFIFTDKDELKEHWNTTEIFCKTCQECCDAYTKGTDEFYPENPEHEGHEWNLIKNKCEECIFICTSNNTLQNHMTSKHGE